MSTGILEKAIRLATSAFAGMLDKQGYPAILHAFVVMLAAGEEYDRSPIPVTREEFMSAAVLHDVVEDTEYTLAYILEQFGPVVANIVDGVTRRKLEKEVYVDFIVRAWQGEASRRLKRVDVTINMKRIHTLPKSEQGIRDRYNRALLILDAKSLEEIQAIIRRPRQTQQVGARQSEGSLL